MYNKMSTVTGLAPVVMYQQNTTTTITDQIAVNHLFNNTSTTLFANYTDKDEQSMAGVYLSTSANKSLFLFKNVNTTNVPSNITAANINVANTPIVDTFSLNSTASLISRADDFRFKVESPDDGVINESNQKLTLSEVEPTSQLEMNALNDIRVLNKTSSLADWGIQSITYSNTNVNAALGVEGKVYYFDGNNFTPNYKSIASYENASSNNITVSFDDQTNNAYNYEVVKVATGDAYFNFTSTQGGSSNVMYGDLTSIDQNSSLSYVDLVGSNDYTGLMGSAIGTVASGDLVVTLSNNANVTQALSNAVSADTSTLKVNPSFVSINNVTSREDVDTLVFADTMSVTLNVSGADFVSTADLPEGSLTITQVSESLPAGHGMDNVTISFNSTDRATVVTSNGYNLTSTIVYAIDGNATLSSLSDNNMISPVVSTTLTVKQVATTNNPITGNADNDSGLNVFPTSGSANLTGFSNTDNLSFIGLVTPAVGSTNIIQVNTDNYTGSVLLALDGTRDFALSVDNINYGNTSGTNIATDSHTGSYKLSYFAGFSPALTGDMRIHFTPSNLLGNATCLTVSSSNMTCGLSSLENATSGLVTYNSGATFGPVSYTSYNELPSSQNYFQTYTINFPSNSELTNTQSAYPETVTVRGHESVEGNIGNELGVPVTIPLSTINTTGSARASFSGANNCITTLTYTIVCDLSLSGVINGSVKVNIPVSYSFNNITRTWIDDVVPSATVGVKFKTEDLVPHKIALEAKNTDGVYTDLDKTDVQEFIDLRRGPFDSLNFSFENKYNLIINLYPQLEQDFYNKNYKIPLEGLSNSLSGGYSAEYVVIDQSQAEYIAQNFNSPLTLQDLQNFMNVNDPIGINMNVNLDGEDTGSDTKYFTISNSGISFHLAASPAASNGYLYFVNLSQSIVQSSSPSMVLQMSNNTLYQLDDGIYVKSSDICSANSGGASNGNFATLSLNRDKYTAIVYDGNVVANNVVIPDIAEGNLIHSNMNGQTYTSLKLTSSILRGFKNESSYTITRGGLTYDASYGDYTQSGSLTPAGINPTDLVLDFGNNLGFALQLVSNPLSAKTVVFNVNKTRVSVLYNGVGYGNVLSSSLVIINHISSTYGAVPYVELLALNNIFVPGTNSATISYVQPDIVVSTNGSYKSANNSVSASDYLNGLTWSDQPSVSDAGLVAANYLIKQHQVNLLYNSANVHRPVGKTYYFTVAPIDVKITLRTGSASTKVDNNVLLDVNQQDLTVAVNGTNANYKLNWAPSLILSSIKSSHASSKFNFKPNVFTLEGSISTQNNWHTYLSQEDITQYLSGDLYEYSFVQYNLTPVQDPTHQNIIYLRWTNNVFRPFYDNSGYSGLLSIAPDTVSQITAYQLTFGYNSSHILVPSVVKTVSAGYDATLSMSAVASKNGDIKTANALSKRMLVLNSAAGVLNLPAEFPYRYVTGSNYPEKEARSTITINSDASYDMPVSGEFIDLSIQVVDNQNVTGSAVYNSLLSIPNGNTNIVKMMNVYVRDQLVVQDYAHNLSFRVGPNGHMYTGDMSAYSASINNNIENGRQLNNNLYPIYNSGVNLQ